MPDPAQQPKVDSAILNVGTSLEKQIGFWARGIIIDNLTNQWIFIREAFAFCPPYVSSRQIPIAGSQKITAMFSAPTGFSNPVIIANQYATIRFTEAPVPASPGIAIPIALIPTALVIDTGDIANNVAVSLIAGVTGQKIYFDFTKVDIQAAGFWWTIRDSTLLTPIARFTVTNSIFDGKGAALPAGSGMDIINETGVVGRAEVSLVTRQG